MKSRDHHGAKYRPSPPSPAGGTFQLPWKDHAQMTERAVSAASRSSYGRISMIRPS